MQVGPALALSPHSPEVRALVQKGVDQLTENFADTRLGALAVTGLALYKAGEKDHELVRKALYECRNAASTARQLDMYSHGLAMIFLSEVGGRSERAAIERYVNVALQRQKPHGGWGYDTVAETRETGDTSQTQYIALGFWQARQLGVSIPREPAQRMVDWLINTQAPDGGWGYQGVLGRPDRRVEQNAKTETMTLAALGSLMIGADLFGMLEGGADDSKADALKTLPAGVRAAASDTSNDLKNLPSEGVPWPQVFQAMRDGDQVLEKEGSLAPGRYTVYKLYTLERYMSLKDFREGVEDPEPEWYAAGYKELLETQKNPGQWNAGCGDDADTAFALLFLLRSTQRSLRARIGEGVMLSGRGLPRNLSRAKVVRGRVVSEIEEVEISGLLDLIEGEDADRLDALAASPGMLQVASLSETDRQRLEQVLRNGSPEARLLAAKALGRVSDLDQVPVLLYALTDPDRRVALAARDALRFTSRRPDGFGLSDNFDDEQRYAALERWKRWYRSVRPNAVLDE